MKKRIFGLLLALALILGVVSVPKFDSDAASQYYRRVKLQSKDVNVTFVVEKADREVAAKKLSKALGVVVKKGKNFNMIINGETVKVQNTKGTIYVDGKTLVDFVKASASEKTSITIKTNLNKVLTLAKISGKGNYKYTIKVGGAVFKNVKVYKSGKITFKANTAKTQIAYIKGGYLYVRGKTQTKFVKKLIKSGVVKSVKLVKKSF